MNDPVHFADVGIEGVGVADDQMQAGAVCGSNDGVAFLKRQSQRLLDQNMLAVLHRLDRLTRVKSMRRRDVDRLDRRIAAQILESRDKPFAPNCCAKASRGRGSGSIAGAERIRG